MDSSWTREEQEDILQQLNLDKQLFRGYEFSNDDGGLLVLGYGGYATVYEVHKEKNEKKQYALKVIGFGNKHVETGLFLEVARAQMNLAYKCNNIVSIVDYKAIRVWVDVDNHMIKTDTLTGYETEKPEGDYLDLEFLLMEKVEPIISRNQGEYKLFPEELQAFDEEEIINLSYQIGEALKVAHSKKLLHRDIKLENVFYDSKSQKYKLGDFGIARMTDDGMASTTAFTRGYGAPEVVSTLDDRYDNTSDLYSFGMMIYVLMNRLRFPESQNYHVNISVQYAPGYRVPRPETGSDELCAIVDKLCCYNADDRYQSIDDAMLDLDALTINSRTKYKREHNYMNFVLGTSLLMAGLFLGKGLYWQSYEMTLNIASLGLCTACIVKSILRTRFKAAGLLNWLIFALGIYILVSTGFTWWKLIGILIMLFDESEFSGLLGGSYLSLYFGQLASQFSTDYHYSIKGNAWVATFFLSAAIYLLLEYSILKSRDRSIDKLYYSANWKNWVVVILYFLLFLTGLFQSDIALMRLHYIFGDSFLYKFYELLFSLGIRNVGLAGTILFTVLNIRDIYYERAGRKKV